MVRKILKRIVINLPQIKDNEINTFHSDDQIRCTKTTQKISDILWLGNGWKHILNYVS